MQVLDIMGTPIEPGDTVVYGVKSEWSTLKVGEVLELIPYEEEDWVPNPTFDPSQPEERTYGRGQVPGGNYKWVRQDVTKYKVRFKEPDEPYTDEHGNKKIQVGRKRTLDQPKRFAVVKKA